ncbi:MAG TPA: hypothetical protein VFX98_14050 [Longimicrobiaceae bacterium]|nr:hypothetical protein [Longimicrobiaceae bacterium]
MKSLRVLSFATAVLLLAACGTDEITTAPAESAAPRFGTSMMGSGGYTQPDTTDTEEGNNRGTSMMGSGL